jgi:hypothetical protein
VRSPQSAPDQEGIDIHLEQQVTGVNIMHLTQEATHRVAGWMTVCWPHSTIARGRSSSPPSSCSCPT